MGLTCLRWGCHKHSRGGETTKQNLRSWIKCVPVFLLSEGSAMPRGSHAPPAASTRPCSTQMAVGRGGGARPCLAIFQTCVCGLYLLWRFVIRDLSCYCCEKTATHWGLGVSCQAQVTRILKTGRGSRVKPGVCPTSLAMPTMVPPRPQKPAESGPGVWAGSHPEHPRAQWGGASWFSKAVPGSQAGIQRPHRDPWSSRLDPDLIAPAPQRHASLSAPPALFGWLTPTHPPHATNTSPAPGQPRLPCHASGTPPGSCVAPTPITGALPWVTGSQLL